jgi:hypothetical protein
MLDWIAEMILTAVSYVPALFVAEESPSFALIRAMFGLLLIVLFVYLIAMRPLRPFLARCMKRMSRIVSR